MRFRCTVWPPCGAIVSEPFHQRRRTDSAGRRGRRGTGRPLLFRRPAEPRRHREVARPHLPYGRFHHLATPVVSFRKEALETFGLAPLPPVSIGTTSSESLAWSS